MVNSCRNYSSPASNIQATAFLVVSVSLLLWIIGDTLIEITPSTKMEYKAPFKSRSKAIDEAVIGADNDHLWWMLQISDIHISSYRNFHIPERLKYFLSEVVPVVKPIAIVATGDLTDAKQANVLNSRQELSEWQQYRKLLDEYLLFGNVDPIWIDIRGNHDKFNVISNSDDLFSKFSQFRHHWDPRTQHIVHRFSVNGTHYAIVAFDATPNPGFRRPFNFFGILPQPALDELRLVDDELSKEGVEMAIWAGHYPTSTIFVGGTLSNQKRFLDGTVVRHGAVYLCGHLHTLHDAEVAMYARHSPLAQLELELGDFQRSERFRLFAVDHGLFSFTDVSLGKWPIVLVTNPKEALHAMPNHEPLAKIAESTHIRILAFSNSPIIYVEVTLNGNLLGNATRHSVAKPLYTFPWDPIEQLPGSTKFHQLEVTVRDENGNIAKENFYFLVDPENAKDLPINIGGPLASLILRSNVPKICRNIFVASSLFSVILLLTARYYPRIYLRLMHFEGMVSFAAKMRRRLFVALLLIIMYPTFGPWLVAEVIDDRFALVFAHGSLLLDDGTFVPDAVASFYGLLNVITFFFPLLFYFGWLGSSPPIASRRSIRVSQRITFQLIILWQLWNAYMDAVAYGWLAFFLSPMRTWSCIFVGYIDMKCRTSLRTS